MFNNRCAIIVTLVIQNFLICQHNAFCFYIDKPGHHRSSRPIAHNNLYDQHHIRQHFTEHKATPCDNTAQITTKPEALLEVIQDSLAFIDKRWPADASILDPTAFGQTSFPFSRVVQTLKYLETVIKKDLKKGVHRIHSPQFLQDHFDFIKWHPDNTTAQERGAFLKKERLRRTVYVTYQVEGSAHKTDLYRYPLYRLKHGHIPPTLTKQEIFNGALSQPKYDKLVKPLVWLSQEGVEDALLQGTIIVKMPDGKKRIFTNDKHNGFAYEQPISPVARQKRYWFFKESSPHHTTHFVDRLAQRKGIVLASDIDNIGLGKLVMLSAVNPQTNTQEMSLCVIADTGGAFKKNLFQVDMFGGIFSSKEAVKNYIKTIPEYVDAYLLVKKA